MKISGIRQTVSKRWKDHPITFSLVVGISILILRCFQLNFVLPQMLFPNYRLTDRIQMNFLLYPKCDIDTQVVWGNGRIRLGHDSFSDQKYYRRTDVKLTDTRNTRGEIVTFDERSLFGTVSVFRYSERVIYAYSQSRHLFAMIDVRSARCTYVNNIDNLPPPHREQFARLLSGSRGNYTAGKQNGYHWTPDSDTRFSDADEDPMISEYKKYLKQQPWKNKEQK